MVSLMNRSPLRDMILWNGAWPETSLRHARSWAGALYPALDVYETDDAVVAKLSVPGVKPEQIEVTLTQNVLQIKGRIEQEEKVQEEQYLHRERTYGHFSRTVTLPGELNAGGATAEFEDGVLTLTVPKAEAAKAKSVQIKAK